LCSFKENDVKIDKNVANISTKITSLNEITARNQPKKAQIASENLKKLSYIQLIFIKSFSCFLAKSSSYK
jgi:hypothetical protein